MAEAVSFYQLERRLRQEERRGIQNYLRSIFLDSKFVDTFCREHSSLPVYANLRNGLWWVSVCLEFVLTLLERYMPKFSGTCYFKSTDGHCGQWSFSMTRLNLHVAEVAALAGGIIIVDSTRRGKVVIFYMFFFFHFKGLAFPRFIQCNNSNMVCCFKSCCPKGSGYEGSRDWHKIRLPRVGYSFLRTQMVTSIELQSDRKND